MLYCLTLLAVTARSILFNRTAVRVACLFALALIGLAFTSTPAHAYVYYNGSWHAQYAYWGGRWYCY